jgi:hypothetical protein
MYLTSGWSGRIVGGMTLAVARQQVPPVCARPPATPLGGRDEIVRGAWYMGVVSRIEEASRFYINHTEGHA